MPGQGAHLQRHDHAPKRLRTSGNDLDVYAMVKGAMSATSLVQPPLLVYPSAFKSSTEAFFNAANCTEAVLHHNFDGERSAEVAKFADHLSKDFPHMARAVRYYRSLLETDKYKKPYLQLAFIAAGGAANECLSNVELGQAPKPPKPHLLQVVFHH